MLLSNSHILSKFRAIFLPALWAQLQVRNRSRPGNPPPPGGFRGVPSILEGRNRPPRTALASTLAPTSRGSRRRPARLVPGRAPGDPARRRGGGVWGAGPTRLAALVDPGSALRPDSVRLQFLALPAERSHPLAQDESGRAWRNVVSELRPEVRGCARASPPPVVAAQSVRRRHHLAEQTGLRAELESAAPVSQRVPTRRIIHALALLVPA